MHGVLREEPVVKYAAIVAHVGLFSVAFMCRVLDIAPSGYYAWLERSPSKKSVRDGVLLVHVRAAFKASRRRYGSPPVHADLHAAGHRVARNRVARLMREDGLRARQRRRFVLTTQSRHKYPIARNVVAREFEVSAPNQVWVSDLTYLRTQTGFVYMAVVLDLFARHGHVHEAGLGSKIGDRKSTRLNSSHLGISYAVFCLKKKKKKNIDLANRSIR